MHDAGALLDDDFGILDIVVAGTTTCCRAADSSVGLVAESLPSRCASQLSRGAADLCFEGLFEAAAMHAADALLDDDVGVLDIVVAGTTTTTCGSAAGSAEGLEAESLPSQCASQLSSGLLVIASSAPLSWDAAVTAGLQVGL
mmetsp:Transcript_48919/g.135961  ORF Transcript_48919/g.135961 Transcript_48919/m.135961 type:complete len:143 (-) Transcript_48919:30-458(-)